LPVVSRLPGLVLVLRDRDAEEQPDEVGCDHCGRAHNHVAQDRPAARRTTESSADPSREEQADHDSDGRDPDPVFPEGEQDHHKGDQRADRERNERRQRGRPGAGELFVVDTELDFRMGGKRIIRGEFDGDLMGELIGEAALPLEASELFEFFVGHRFELPLFLGD